MPGEKSCSRVVMSAKTARAAGILAFAMNPIIPASGLLFAQSLSKLSAFAPHAGTGAMPTATPRSTFSIREPLRAWRRADRPVVKRKLFKRPSPLGILCPSGQERDQNLVEQHRQLVQRDRFRFSVVIQPPCPDLSSPSGTSVPPISASNSTSPPPAANSTAFATRSRSAPGSTID